MQQPELPRLTNLQILDIVSDDIKFIALIRDYNQAGLHLIRNELFDQALLQLQQAEKILEYAANCGKTIERYLIASTLHNEACAYQKLWELEKSSDYMEAIIYNISTFLNQLPVVQMSHPLRDNRSKEYKNLSSYLHHRLKAVAYHLQYSAVSSQIGRHPIAISSTRKALSLMEEALTQGFSYECFVKGRVNRKSQLRLLREECLGIDPNRVPSMLQECRKKLKQIQQSCEPESEEYGKMKKLSISELMQIEPITTAQAEQYVPIESLLSAEGFSQMVYFVSIAYYTMATQLRLMNSTRTEIKKKSLQLEKSMICHINAIRVAIEYVPCISDYVTHIHKSLKKNFNIDLMEVDKDEDASFKDQLSISPEILENQSLFKTGQSKDNEPIDFSTPSQHNKKHSQSEITPPFIQNQGQNETLGLTLTKDAENREKKKKRKSKSRSISGSRKVIKKISSSTKMMLMPRNSINHISPKKIPENNKIMAVFKNNKNTELNHVKSEKIIISQLPGFSQKQLPNKNNSNEKTKDQSKKREYKKMGDKKKFQDEYNIGMKEKKKGKQKDKNKCSISGKKQKNLKSKSKGKILFHNKGLSHLS